jgi:hypothetical protein
MPALPVLERVRVPASCVDWQLWRILRMPELFRVAATIFDNPRCRMERAAKSKG